MVAGPGRRDGEVFGPRLVRAARRGWQRRFRWRGFLRRQKVATIAAWSVLITPVLVVFGLQGPEVRLTVIDEFRVHPWPTVCLFAALAVAVVCVGSGSSVLPKRRAWRAVVLAAAGVPAGILFASYLDGRAVATAMELGLGISALVLAVGLAGRRVGWAMAGVAASYAALALLVLVLLIPGFRAPSIGSPIWFIGLATHQLTFGLGYLVFLATTLTAPIGLLTGTAARSRRAQDWLDSPRFHRAWLIGGGVAGLTLLIWLLPLRQWSSSWRFDGRPAARWSTSTSGSPDGGWRGR